MSNVRRHLRKFLQMSLLKKLFRSRTPAENARPEDKAYRRMWEPEPKFLGVLISSVFLDARFGLNEKERLECGAAWPAALESNFNLWTSAFLSWIVSKLVADRYGAEFAERAVKSIAETAGRIENEQSRTVLGAVAELLRPLVVGIA